MVNKFGILKLIDFGSAVHFRKEIPKGYYITSDDIMLAPNYKLIRARGVVGSDPYLSLITISTVPIFGTVEILCLFRVCDY